MASLDFEIRNEGCSVGEGSSFSVKAYQGVLFPFYSMQNSSANFVLPTFAMFRYNAKFGFVNEDDVRL